MSQLVFHRHSKLLVSVVSTRRQWWSKCGRFVVERVDYKSKILNRIWRSLEVTGIDRYLLIIGSHRTKAAAIKAAERTAG